ncbi:hypothetical protein PFLU3_09570 [Pseudomonas fluorescens]|uniref:DUF4142 domain-containing protein n=2 Tax=Pseudomonas TaxID=286 RepID=A0A0D0TKB5_PSEFL|nr:hypothetical protein C4K02_4339 [Pseudomonas synxantha]KIR23606.1 hypothetical protein PFLU3_09570 [Pseudomonas fluorescens]
MRQDPVSARYPSMPLPIMRVRKMKAKYGVLLFGMALLSTPVLADQATYDAIAAVGLPLSDEHGQAMIAAGGAHLVEAVGNVQAAHLDSIVEVTAAAAGAAPSNAAAYAAQAIMWAPHHADAIKAATVAAAPDYADVIHAIVAQDPQLTGVTASSAASAIWQRQSIPSSGGGGGTASRN